MQNACGTGQQHVWSSLLEQVPMRPGRLGSAQASQSYPIVITFSRSMNLREVSRRQLHLEFPSRSWGLQPGVSDLISHDKTKTRTLIHGWHFFWLPGRPSWFQYVPGGPRRFCSLNRALRPAAPRSEGLWTTAPVSRRSGVL